MRHAFLMRLYPGSEDEYRRRHDEIWPELAGVLRSHGVSNYSIYRNGLDLFAYLEAEDAERLAAMSDNPVVRRWWTSMAPLMDTNPDDSPVQVPLTEVFHLD